MDDLSRLEEMCKASDDLIGRFVVDPRTPQALSCEGLALLESHGRVPPDPDHPSPFLSMIDELIDLILQVRLKQNSENNQRHSQAIESDMMQYPMVDYRPYIGSARAAILTGLQSEMVKAREVLKKLL